MAKLAVISACRTNEKTSERRHIYRYANAQTAPINKQTKFSTVSILWLLFVSSMDFIPSFYFILPRESESVDNPRKFINFSESHVVRKNKRYTFQSIFLFSHFVNRFVSYTIVFELKINKQRCTLRIDEPARFIVVIIIIIIIIHPLVASHDVRSSESTNYLGSELTDSST